MKSNKQVVEPIISPIFFNEGCNGASCFVAGTLVHTDKGLVPIEQIKVGDLVLSRPEDGGDSFPTEYKGLLKYLNQQIKKIFFLLSSLANIVTMRQEALNIYFQQIIPFIGNKI